MGGNAIKAAHGVETVRLEKRDYHRVAFAARDLLPSECEASVVPAYRNKANFGDADIVYASELPPDYLTSRFPLHVKNGNVLSVAWSMKTYEGPESFFQVDYIKVPADTYDFALGYFSYNDLGNLLGRVAHRMGLKFGHDGLWVVLREGDYVVADVLVTKDFDLALSILGYEPTYDFDDLEQIFQYVTTSRYFSKDLYPLEHRNTKARMRDRKRATYNAFLQWLDQTQPPDGVGAIPRNESVARANATFATLQRISKLVPGFSERLVAARQKHAVSVLERSLFNGELVSNTVSLTGKDLGMFISYFKDYVGHDLFSFWVLSTDQNHKECALRAAYVKYQEQGEII